MRSIKMLGVAALAAAVVMAVLGTTTASAKVIEGVTHGDVLCKVNEEPCAPADVLPAGTPVKAQTTFAEPGILKMTILGMTKEVSCKGEEATGVRPSQVEGKTKEEIGQRGTSEEELGGKIETLTFTNCFVVGTSAKCIVTATQLNYQTLLEQDKEHPGDGHLFVFEHEKTEPTEPSHQPGAIVECEPVMLITVNCVFKGAEKNEQEPGVEGINFQVEGGNPAHIVANQAQLKQVKEPGHESCPGTEPKWTVKYEVHAPEPVWVSHV